MSGLKILYFVVTIYDVVTGVIFISEFLEDFSFLSHYLKKEDRLQRYPLYILRVIILSACVGITFISENLADILDLGGGFCASFLSLIIPVFFALIWIGFTRYVV